MSTMWGENPTILACGHLCEPFAAFRWGIDGLWRRCDRCGTWEHYVTAPDLDMVADVSRIDTGYDAREEQ